MAGLTILSGYLVSVDYLAPLVAAMVGWHLGAVTGLLNRRKRK